MYLPSRSEYVVSGFSLPFKKINWQAPSFAYIFAGNGVVFENSRVTFPHHDGSRGVTLTIIPHLAYVDFPKQITRTSSGILKYSIVLASTNEFGGIIHSEPFLVTKLVGLKFFGSTISVLTFVDILNSFHKVSWKWVKAHAGHRENEIADMLANKGIDDFKC